MASVNILDLDFKCMNNFYLKVGFPWVGIVYSLFPEAFFLINVTLKFSYL